MLNHKAIMLGMGYGMPILASIAVIARLVSRSLMRAGPKLDDWTIVLALIFDIALSVNFLVGTTSGGIGVWDEKLVTKPKLQVFEICIWTGGWLMALAPGLTKISVILLYRRIFLLGGSGRRLVFRAFLWASMAISIIWTVGYFFSNIFNCHPIDAQWSVSSDPKGVGKECVHLIDLWISQAISDTIIDAMILVLPIVPVTKLQLPLAKRISVLGMFLLGGFTVVSNIMRVYYLWGPTHHLSAHTSYDKAPAFYWYLIQAAVGIVSACLPCLTPLFSTASAKSAVRGTQNTLSRFRSERSRHSDSNDSSSRHIAGRSSVWRFPRFGAGSSDSQANLARVEPDVQRSTLREQTSEKHMVSVV